MSVCGCLGVNCITGTERRRCDWLFSEANQCATRDTEEEVGNRHEPVAVVSSVLPLWCSFSLSFSSPASFKNMFSDALLISERDVQKCCIIITVCRYRPPVSLLECRLPPPGGVDS